MRTSLQLSKTLLVASDQSYFTPAALVKVGADLAELPDQDPKPPAEYRLERIYRDTPQYLWPLGYKVTNVLDLSAQIGAKALVYMNQSREVIVAFGGTDGLDAQDWKVNTQSAGWEQWVILRPLVFNAIEGIRARSDVIGGGGIKSINFTGQSLGGALAQYAAFDLLRDENFKLFERKVTLTTFNALGAGLALQTTGKGNATSAEIAAFSNKLGQVAHYVVDNDLVSRLGGSHIGSNGLVIKFNWTYLAGEKTGKPLDIVDAHRIETAFYTHVQIGNEFGGGDEIDERLRLIETPTSLKWAGGVGNLLNNETVTPGEAYFRLLAGVSAAVTNAESNEIDAVLQAAADAQWRAGKMSSRVREFLGAFNLGGVGKLLLDESSGRVLYYGALLGAVLVDPAVRASVSTSIAAWLRGLTGRSTIELPTEAQPMPLQKVLAIMAAEPAVFKTRDQQVKAQALKNRVRPGFTGRQAEEIFRRGLRAGADNLAVELTQTASSAQQAPKDRAMALMESENWYWSTALSGGGGDPAVSAQVHAERAAFWNSDFGLAIAKLNSEYLGLAESPIALIGLTTFAERKGFIDAVLSALRTGAETVFNALPRAEAGTLAQQIRSVSQTVVIANGRPANPFDISAFDPSAAVTMGAIKEGQVREFSIFVPYEAQAGGQYVALKLSGAAANTFRLVLGNVETPLGPDGSFSLRIKEGQRSVSFGLRAKDDVDLDQTLGLSATLVDAAGVPTHKTNLELNLALDARQEPTAPTTTISGSDLLSNRLVALPGGSTLEGKSRSDYLVGGAGNDRLIGGSGMTTDWLSGNLGNNWMEAGAGEDVIILGQGEDYADGGADRDFIGYFGADVYPASLDTMGGDNVLFQLTWQGVANFNAETGVRDIAFEAAWTGRNVSATRTKLQNFVTRTTFTEVHGKEIRGGGGADIINAGPGADLIYGDHGPGASALPNASTGEADGADFVIAGAGDDTVFGGGGADALMGSDGADYIDGEAGDDAILGDSGNDALLGGAANDTLYGDAPTLAAALHGADYLDGGDGNDALWGGGGADSLFGGDGNDQLVGDDAGLALQFQGADYLDGEAGDDLLVGYGGADELFGGTGNDQLQGGAGDDYLDGEAGNDQLFGEDGADRLFGGDGADDLLGGAGGDYLDGEAGDDFLAGDAGDDELFGGDGIDELYGDAGADVLDGEAGADLLRGGDGDDTLFGGVDNDQLTGDNGNDALSGGVGADYLLGGAGNDVLEGGAGNDLLEGGSGNDTYVLSSGDGTDTIRDAEGVNRIHFVDAPNADALTVRAGADNGMLVIEYGAPGDAVFVQGGVGGSLQELEFADGSVISSVQFFAGLQRLVITGTSQSDVLESTYPGVTVDAGAGDDTVRGSGAADILLGGAGNDMLDGGAGADTLQGGTGNDAYVVDNAGDVIIEAAGEGTDTVRSAVTYALGGNVENLVLTGVAAINGAGNALDNVLTGNAAANLLSGGPGNDMLDGAAGADMLRGGAGNDTYFIDTPADVVSENPNEGIDTVSSSVTYTLGANVENLTLTGTAPISATGNALDNKLAGNGANNVLDGGAGADMMTGGAGNDTYVVDNAADTIVENANEGTDLVQSAVSYVLGFRVENLTLTGTAAIDGTGNELINVIRGNAAANVLNGSSGADTMIGGLGDDTYVVENAADVVIENAGEGTDSIRTWISMTLPRNVENLRAEGVTALNLTGNDADNALLGNAGRNRLMGGAGNDFLNGGLAIDNLLGGIGNDTYEIEAATDVIVENAGEGIDTVMSWAGYALGGNVENLTLLGAAGLSGTGNALDNLMVGNAGANVLAGGAGNDTLNGREGADMLSGGIGNDTYEIDAAADMIVENAGEGVDTVRSWIAHTLAPNVENLTLLGTAGLSGTGNALDNAMVGNTAANVLYGEAGNDTLDGREGADTMVGGTGNDTYFVESAGDLVIENAGEGVDTVQSSINYALGAYVEALTLVGSAVAGTGNALANTLRGNASKNTIDGGAGADTMSGGAGDDMFVVDDAGDIIVENANEGRDTAQSAISYTLGANVENLTLIGTGAINGNGNALANVIVGNSGANVLVGGADNDTLDGGAGVDTLVGGAGDDIYVLDTLRDVIIEDANSGTDTVRIAVSYALAPYLENLVLTGAAAVDGTGNAVDNVITGNTANNRLFGGAGNDRLDGGAGADAMVGGAGNDTYLVDNSGDTAVEIAGEGTDTVLAAVSYTLGLGVENVTLTGAAAINGIGNALNNLIIGNAASNALFGGSGDDTLDGRAGADTLAGQLGNDAYVVDNVSDLVVENIAEGIDTVYASVGYSLAANVEKLMLTGSAALTGSGNALDNFIRGNSGNNFLQGSDGNDTLEGGAGIDRLVGGAGNDVYVVDTATDVIEEFANQGNDTVSSSVTNKLGANVENLTLTGTAAIDAAGNSLNNVLTGNSANNLLDGWNGADTLIGGAGNDSYVIDDAGDVIRENLNEGVDTARAWISYALAANVERLILENTGAINGTGNALDNELTGNGYANVLSGGAGNDRLTGGGGADTLVGGLGDDTYLIHAPWDGFAVVDGIMPPVRFAVPHERESSVELPGQGHDSVYSPISWTLDANVEDLYLADTALPIWTRRPQEVLAQVRTASRVEGIGNDADNMISGGAKANFLDGRGGNDLLLGGGGDDDLDGGAGNDRLDGGEGADRMYGGDGDDVFIVDNAGDGTFDTAGTDTVISSVSHVIGAGIETLVLVGTAPVDGKGNAIDNLIIGNAAANRLDGGRGGRDTLRGGAGDDVYFVDNLDGLLDVIDEKANEGFDTVQSEGSHTLAANVEKLVLLWDTFKWGAPNLRGETARGNASDNELVASIANDTLLGEGGNDLLRGGFGFTTMDGGAGNDILQAAAGGGVLTDISGNNVLHDGAGWDALRGGTGSDFFIGAAGRDTITTGGGRDIIAFNRGDGKDLVNASSGADDTLSIGGGIRYADMSLSKELNDLVLNLGGTGDQITFKDWYAAPGNKSVLNMQVIAEAMADFNAASSDKLVNRKIESFDFLGIAGAFDAAGAPINWALTNALLSRHLAGSDTAALGGDLAYQYGKRGSLAGMGFDAVQGMLASGSFGVAAQALQAPAALNVGPRVLS